MEQSFDEIDFEAEDFRDAGDNVVAFVRMRGRGKGSGIEVEARIAHLWTMRDGKGVRVRVLERKPPSKPPGCVSRALIAGPYPASHSPC